MIEVYFAIAGLAVGAGGTGYLWYRHATALGQTITALQVQAASVKTAATSVVADIKKAV